MASDDVNARQRVMTGGWQFMLHYMAFATYDHQESARNINGATQFNGIDWFMGMAQHDVGAGRLGLRAMLQHRPFTVGKAGYPAAAADRRVVSRRAAARPAAPARSVHGAGGGVRRAGNVQRRRRALRGAGRASRHSARSPTAPPVGRGRSVRGARPSLAGRDPYLVRCAHGGRVHARRSKLEGSIFNGREPDETRTNFDFRTLDSYSATRHDQPGAGVESSARRTATSRVRNSSTPNVAQHRMGASVLFDQPFNAKGEWSTALVYGANLYSDSPQLSNSVDLETTLDIDGTNSISREPST